MGAYFSQKQLHMIACNEKISKAWRQTIVHGERESNVGKIHNPKKL